jgi:hypothetical protein
MGTLQISCDTISLTPYTVLWFLSEQTVKDSKKYIFFLYAFSDHLASTNGSPIKTQDHVMSKQTNNSLRPEDAALRRLHANIQDMKDIQGPVARGHDPVVTLRSGRGPWNLEQKYKRHSSYVSRDHSREANHLVKKNSSQSIC